LSVLSTAGVSASNVTTAETQNSTEQRTASPTNAARITTLRPIPITSKPYVAPPARTTTRYFQTTSTYRPAQNGTTRIPPAPGFVSPGLAPNRTTTSYSIFPTTARPPYFPRSTTPWNRRQGTTTNYMAPQTTHRSAAATTRPTGAAVSPTPTPPRTVQPAQPAELSTRGRQRLTPGTRPPSYYTSQPRSVHSTTPFVVTSAPSYTERGEVIHCHVQLANNYEETLNSSGHERQFYAHQLRPRIADLCGVDDTRISDVSVFENPQTGATFTHSDN